MVGSILLSRTSGNIDLPPSSNLDVWSAPPTSFMPPRRYRMDHLFDSLNCLHALLPERSLTFDFLSRHTSRMPG